MQHYRARRLAFLGFGAGIGLSGFLIFKAVRAQEAPSAPATTRSAPAYVEGFDDVVRDDLFAGFAGDKESYDRAVRIIDQAMAKHPRDPHVMVWQAAQRLFESGQDFGAAGRAFAAGNQQKAMDLQNKGVDLWTRGIKEMDDAVALAPDDIEALIPQAAVYLSIANYDPNPVESKRLLTTGVNDYEKVLSIQTQQAQFPKLSAHARGELLFGLASGWYQLGDADKSRGYLQWVEKDLPKTDYSTRATDWLATQDKATLMKKTQTYSCMGCHAE